MKPILLCTLCLLTVAPSTALAQAPLRCDAEAAMLSAENQGRLVNLLEVEPATIVEAIRDCPDRIYFYSPLLMNAALSGDAGLRPMLREIVANRAYGEDEDWEAAQAALLPLAWLGEEPSYFLDLAQVLTQPLTIDDWKEYGFGDEAAMALSLHPDSSLRAPLEALAASASDALPLGVGRAGIAVLNRVLAMREAYRALLTVRERVAFTVEMGWPVDGSVCEADGDRPIRLCRGIKPDDAYVLTLLRDLAATHPDSVRTYLPAVLAEWDEEPVSDAAYAADPFAWVANRAALPFEPFPAPPENPQADVAPLVECVEEQSGGVLVAHFGYYNRFGAPVTVIRGAANSVTPSAFGGSQPEGFGVPRALGQPVGRTAPFPAFAWRTAFADGESVTWSLPGGSATASAASPRCGAPPVATVPECDGRPATVYVAADGTISGGPDDGQPYTGTLRGTTGPDVIAGTDGPDTLVGQQGDDLLCGRSGDDTLRGSAGRDTLFGGAGDDELRGDNDDDTLWGGPGNDALLAGAGDDIAYGEAGDDTVQGAGGDDTGWGGPGADTLRGNGGADTLRGGDGDDRLEGGSGDDTLVGDAGTDEARGGGGVDACDAETETSCEGPPAAGTGSSG